MAKPPKNPPSETPSSEEKKGPNAEEAADLASALLAAFPAGTTRALLVRHVPAEGETYDAGRKYELRLLEVVDGVASLRTVTEVANGKQTHAMPFHVALSHLERHFADFLKPEQYR